ncbi:unnamed protein product, partial [Pocillopora meandrina]
MNQIRLRFIYDRNNRSVQHLPLTLSICRALEPSLRVWMRVVRNCGTYSKFTVTVWMLALPFSSLVFLIPGQECTYVGMPFAVILLFTICG